MKNITFSFCFLLLSLCSIGISSCVSDDIFKSDSVSKTILSIHLKNNNVQRYTQMQAEFLEVNSGQITKVEFSSSSYTVMLKPGSYRISLDGQAVLNSDETIGVGALKQVDLSQELYNLDLEVSIKSFNSDFIIEEVFYTGVKTLQGKSYNAGKYFKIINNTDSILNTGGLAIAQSELLSINDYQVTPDVKTEALAVKAVLYIEPEFGKNVLPGDFIVVSDMAMNHNMENVPGFDLSLSDYEFPNLDNPVLAQVDNPKVDNAKVIYSSLNYNMFVLHSGGVEAYALFRLPQEVGVKDWLQHYKYDYQYINIVGKITKKSVYKVPNNWIIDGVNNAPSQAWLQNPLDASIDSGYTGVGNVNNDPGRFGLTIRRKVIGTTSQGKNIYKDTNNSKNDFVFGSESSLKQGIVH